MNILLLSMPDSFEHMPTVAVRMPNGALTSLAGNLDPQHNVAVADLSMLAHTFRGSTLRTFLGLEDQRAAFRRYRQIRAAERDYLSI